VFALPVKARQLVLLGNGDWLKPKFELKIQTRTMSNTEVVLHVDI